MQYKRNSPMSGIERKLDDIRDESNRRFEAVQEELRRLSEAMLQLIKTQGEVLRLDDGMKRMGKQLDEISEKTLPSLEERLRRVETAQAMVGSDARNASKNLWWVMTIIGSAVTSGITYVLSHR